LQLSGEISQSNGDVYRITIQYWRRRASLLRSGAIRPPDYLDLREELTTVRDTPEDFEEVALQAYPTRIHRN